MEIVLSFLNSAFFTSFTTAIVGTFAIVLYIKQKKDRKRDAASLILQEIRFAEQQIRTATGAGGIPRFTLGIDLLPTNNWNVNIHLFLNDLEETELDLISRFYSRATYIDELIGKISDFRNQEKRPSYVITQSSAPAGTQPVIQVPPLPLDPMEETQKILKITCDNVESVYNTPTGEKLKALARRKFLWIL